MNINIQEAQRTNSRINQETLCCRKTKAKRESGKHQERSALSHTKNPQYDYEHTSHQKPRLP